ncbi:hypothetical protein [Pseudomonas sp. 37 R 15]|nr:hypothetical protein [Pseudomonas sp. 37 R 15]
MEGGHQSGLPLVVTMSYGVAHGLDFNQKPHSGQILDGRYGNRCDSESAILDNVDQSTTNEPIQRLSEWAAAETELPLQLLHPKPIPRLELAVDKRFAQRVISLINQRQRF